MLTHSAQAVSTPHSSTAHTLTENSFSIVAKLDLAPHRQRNLLKPLRAFATVFDCLAKLLVLSLLQQEC